MRRNPNIQYTRMIDRESAVHRDKAYYLLYPPLITVFDRSDYATVAIKAPTYSHATAINRGYQFLSPFV